jgi:RNA polymerase sigma factor (sigma-70 family)
MTADSVASTPETGSDEQLSSRAAEPARVSEAHAKQIAQLFQDEYANVVHFIAARAASWPEARDIAAEAFAQILQKPDPETVSFLRAYVYRAARNIAINRAMLGAARRRIIGIARHEFTSTSPSPEPALIKQQRLQVLGRAMEGMKPSRRMLLKLRMWEELSFADILARFAAEGLVVNERTLYRWYGDALEELRTAIEAAEDLKGEGVK